MVCVAPERQFHLATNGSDDIWFPINKMDAAQAQLDTAIFLSARF
jgi:hypothetical protein